MDPRVPVKPPGDGGSGVKRKTRRSKPRLNKKLDEQLAKKKAFKKGYAEVTEVFAAQLSLNSPPQPSISTGSAPVSLHIFMSNLACYLELS